MIANKTLIIRIIFVFGLLVGFVLVAFVGNRLINSFRYAGLEKIPITEIGVKDVANRAIDTIYAFTGDSNTRLKIATVYDDDRKLEKLTSSNTEKIAAKFGFTKNQVKTGSILIWNEGDKRFIADLENETITFAESATTGPLVKIDKFPPAGDVAQKAKKILGELGVKDQFIDFQKAEIKFKTLQGIEIETEKEFQEIKEARIMEVSYFFEPGYLSYYGKSFDSQKFKIQVNPINKVVGFESPWVINTWDSIGEYPLISVNQAYSKINKGGGSIVNITTIISAPGTQIQRKITAINFSKVNLGYFPIQDSSKSYLVPIYIFSGKASMVSGEILEITVFTIAVEDKFLSSNEAK